MISRTPVHRVGHRSPLPIYFSARQFRADRFYTPNRLISFLNNIKSGRSDSCRSRTCLVHLMFGALDAAVSSSTPKDERLLSEH